MDSVIKTLEKKIHSLKCEMRIWSKEPNNKPEIVKVVKKELSEHLKALELINTGVLIAAAKVPGIKAAIELTKQKEIELIIVGSGCTEDYVKQGIESLIPTSPKIEPGDLNCLIQQFEEAPKPKKKYKSWERPYKFHP